MDQFNQQPNADSILPYDVVGLPSNGIYYKNKKTSLKVTYLTAADENILSSPGVAQSGGLIDSLLRRKVLDKDIKIEDLANCDKEAILIFLRNTAFGPEYEVTMTDQKTGEKFNHTIDLSVLKTKEMSVEVDDNGEFEYMLPVSKKKVRLKFLTPQDDKTLSEIDKTYKDHAVNPYMTKRLEMWIKELDGSRDNMFIAQAIQAMPIRDSQSIRKIITENTPEIDLGVKVTTPSGDEVTARIAFGSEFFRPFYGI